ncbi:putative NAD-dependent deacetylase [Mobilicoccus pelagius NBRC 104925]|uniref:Putative NAD-dependent deacetylase n=1 Tax=Mobilicoccus pelagius NBRC 104925 TaxID=1089455 RepID=H5URJ0_9MICO|nr:putative NAD-dependent deacetylase [Mobilicoccus pelagius NBRC 104925]
MLVVGGTTLSVHPAAGMVQYCRGRDLVVVDLEPTAFDARADLLIHAELGEVLGEAAGVE